MSRAKNLPQYETPPLREAPPERADDARLQPVKDKLAELLQLKENWDGYGGLPLIPKNAEFVLHVWKALLRAEGDGPPLDNPSIIPGNDGTVQIEWHYNDYVLELDIEAPFRCFVLVSRPGEEFRPGEKYEEYELGARFDKVVMHLREIKQKAIDARNRAKA